MAGAGGHERLHVKQSRINPPVAPRLAKIGITRDKGKVIESDSKAPASTPRPLGTAYRASPLAGHRRDGRRRSDAELAVAPYNAARLTDALRRALIERGESFVFETVFSDPVGEKVAFLEEVVQRGYVVVLCYIGLSSPDQSAQRVAMRVSQGGHDVPDDKLGSTFPRTLNNLLAAIARLPHVLFYDKSDLNVPYRQVAIPISLSRSENQVKVPMLGRKGVYQK